LTTKGVDAGREKGQGEDFLREHLKGGRKKRAGFRRLEKKVSRRTIEKKKSGGELRKKKGKKGLSRSAEEEKKREECFGLSRRGKKGSLGLDRGVDLA